MRGCSRPFGGLEHRQLLNGTVMLNYAPDKNQLQVNMVGKTLANLEERGKQQARTWRMRGATMESRQSDDVGGLLPMEEEDKLALFHVLNGQRLGMERLGSIVKRDVRDAGIMKDEITNMTSSSGGRNNSLLSLSKYKLP